ncbi:hypothetical protein H9N28_05970 [Rhodobacter capsulatus]|uniref:Uncharacterized protein n=1 Tax=Rhodobacter capsulatus TaxID=1061 RepID=A0A1G7JG24_RHOCA|nr:hypothetical protein [Rhodobacter capsulatus]PZX27286.1 hypothetical protein LY44_00659 [Rhodobacter capsulatus]QNR64373.1 hypothetical protein H9N28_05970 [Rhodobacter capsulatus]WER07831.1 hypothetical protein PUH89_10795 [Rhodobacter capsulatus]SDF23887.1 hypothetical protein SAMN04244550_01922 [Rhodobacter capsulatus]
MQAVLSEGYRSVSLVFDLAADRILVPVAIFVALAGALVIGIEVSALLSPADPALYQL